MCDSDSLGCDSLGSWPHPFRGYPQHFSQVHEKCSNSTVELRNRCLLKSSGEAKKKTYHTPYSRNQKHSPIDVFVTPKFLLICQPVSLFLLPSLFPQIWFSSFSQLGSPTKTEYQAKYCHEIKSSIFTACQRNIEEF